MAGESYPWSLVTAKESVGEEVIDYVMKTEERAKVVERFGQPTVREEDMTEDDVTPKDEITELCYPLNFLAELVSFQKSFFASGFITAMH
ncbi:unnamed protein product [Dibothriocephalus latus]|uniref:Uncharacterized protein n=1 Tax=Dibothriocephalus latus TaxID=60516 RepID=A0A3P7P3N4_DIBLA|nr:unnamed protein product [Dibothriocephalus latus]